MYLEFLILTTDYFKTLNRKVVIYELIVPMLLSLFSAIFYRCYAMPYSAVYSEFKESSINILGILLGFSIAIITILVTGNGKNLEEIKKRETSICINGSKASLYELILINFSYSVIAEIILIISCLIMPVINKIVFFSSNIKLGLYSIMVFIVLHILLLTLRNITDFYLVITKK